MKRTIISIIAAGVLATVGSAQLVYNVTGDTGVQAQFTFTFDTSLNTVTVFVENSSSGVGGANGRITGFGFYAPFSDAELGTNASLVSLTEDAPGDWNFFEPYELSGDSGIYFQTIGVGTGATEQGGGGDPGIAAGASATFVFTFPDFDNGDVWGGEDSLSVRFQSVVDSNGTPGQSDKVLGTPDDGGGGGSGFVPEPSTYGLFGALALLGLMVTRQMRRR